MNRTRTILLIILAVGIATGVIVYRFVYNKSHPDYQKELAVYTLEAKEVFNEFRTNPDEANEKYTGTMIQVHGQLEKVEKTDSLTVAIFVLDQGMFGDEGVRCTLLPAFGNKISQTDLPKKMQIKGLCTGYNDTDVVMEHCSIK